MAKLNEITYDIRESLKEFSDDSEISNRYLTHLINLKRAKYLRQDLNNFQKTTDISIQQSFCLELEEASSSTCGVGFFCEKLLRSKNPIPKPIELHTNVAITKIKPTNRLSVPFNFISISKVPYYGYAPYNRSVYAFIDTDNHIYIISKSDTYKLVDCISVTGIFENPLDLASYTNCCDCIDEPACFDVENTEYPLQPHYVDLIKAEIVNDLLRLKRVQEDKVNDSNDEEQK